MRTVEDLRRRGNVTAELDYLSYLHTGDMHYRSRAYVAVWIITGRFFTSDNGWL